MSFIITDGCLVEFDSYLQSKGVSNYSLEGRRIFSEPYVIILKIHGKTLTLIEGDYFTAKNEGIMNA